MHNTFLVWINHHCMVCGVISIHYNWMESSDSHCIDILVSIGILFVSVKKLVKNWEIISLIYFVVGRMDDMTVSLNPNCNFFWLMCLTHVLRMFGLLEMFSAYFGKLQNISLFCVEFRWRRILNLFKMLFNSNLYYWIHSGTY